MNRTFLKGILVGITLTFLALASIGHAANGGLFGEILNLILTGNRGGVAGKTWENPGDGTVNNAAKLGGYNASNFQKVVPNQSCGAGKCIYGFDTSGNVMCR